MKRYLLLLSIFGLLSISTFAKTSSTNKEQLWHQLDSCLEYRAPETGQKLATNLNTILLKEKDSDDYAKLLIYRMRFAQMNEEKYLPDFIQQMEAELKTSWMPFTNLLHSMIAESYKNYYSNNRYSFYKRNTQEGSEAQTIETLTKAQIYDTIQYHINSSLKNPTNLLKETLTNWKNMVELGTKPLNLRSNLYDLLLWRGVDMLKDCRDLSDKPEYLFNLTNPNLFRDSNTFFNDSIVTHDPQNNLYLAMKLIQNGTSFYSSNNDIIKLADIELNRLILLNGEIYPASKEYIPSLERFIKTYESLPISALARFYLADKYNEINTEKTLQICQSAIDTYPRSEGGIQCKALVEDIKSKTAAVTLETIYPSAQKIIGLVEFKNITTLYGRLYRVTNLNDEVVANIDSLLKYGTLVKSMQLPMKKYDDYQFHKEEFVLDSLKPSLYALVTSVRADFANKENVLTNTQFQVSNIYLIKDVDNTNRQFVVINRVTGKPIVGAKSILSTYNDYNFRGHSTTINLMTNASGELYFTDKLEEAKSYKLIINLGIDRLEESESYIYNYKEPVVTKVTRDYILTDRKIYRPNQPIYFKVVSFTTDGKNAVANKSQHQTINLHDTNGKIIATKGLTTNEFGSASGEFHIPASVLNGDWRITSNEGTSVFQVEEYVRPKFEVEFLPITQLLLAGDTVAISGLAKSYGQLLMSGCKVKYLIKREDTYQTYYRYRNPLESVLVSDTTTTNAEGVFRFNFIIPKEEKLANYQISVQVTSSVGETITKESNVTVTSRVAEIISSVDAIYEVGQFPTSINVSTINTNNTPVKIPLSYAIYNLIGDQPLIPQKRWELDGATPTQRHYMRSMPTVENGADLTKLPIQSMVSQGNMDIDSAKIEQAILNKLQKGIYRIIITANATKGDTIQATHNFVVEEFEGKQLEKPSFLYMNAPNQELVGGDTLRFNLGSSLADATIFYQILWNNHTSSNGQVVADNSKQVIEIPLPKSYEGDLVINTFLVNQNRLYYQSASKPVLSTDKSLSLKLITFRDKITPNSNESWKLQVLNNKLPISKSEVVATMYDASLDAFVPNYYNGFYSLFSTKYIYNRAWPQRTHFVNNGWTQNSFTDKYQFVFYEYPSLKWYNLFNSNYGIVNEMVMHRSSPTPVMAKGLSIVNDDIVEEESREDAVKVVRNSTSSVVTTSPKREVELRRNFQETAFFIPHLTTDSTGTTNIEFTAPETITTWKLMAFAHTTDGKSGSLTYKTTTQKELMVQPNLPRFLYQDDKLELKATISRVGNVVDSCKAILTITDEAGKSLNHLIKCDTIQSVKFASNNSVTVSWSVDLKGIDKAIVVKTVAISTNHTDGEQRYLPILPNKQRVVESLPFYALNKGVKKMEFTKLKEGASKFDNRKLKLTYTQNASWEVVKALPYLLESSDENSDAIFNRYYANALAINILRSNSAIANTLERWSHESDSAPLKSPLQTNDESKLIALDQTPWVSEGENESDARQRLVTLLNRSKVETDASNTLSKLLANQQANGGWPWFKGMETSLQLSQYITKGLMEMCNDSLDLRLLQSPYVEMVNSAISYCDKSMVDEYYRAIEVAKKMKDTLFVPSPSIADIEYFAARHLIKTAPNSSQLDKVESVYMQYAKSNWIGYTPEYQAVIALWSFRSGDNYHSKILESLYQCAIKSPEMGNYYKREASRSYFRADIEQHGTILNAFAEIGGYNEHVKLMQLHLIQQKRTNNWNGTKATTLAIKSLLVNGSKWLDSSAQPDVISVGDKSIKANSFEPVSYSWSGSEINKSLATIKIEKKNSTPSWGALEWDYYANMSDITANSQNPLTVKREYFKVVENVGAPAFEAVSDESELHVGDKVMIRLTVKTDRAMEFVHLKDNRAAAFEPLEIFSGFNYNGGVGYYQNMKDASSNFYIHYLPKGVWRVEYTVRVSQEGYFQSGTGTVQCYYAPEFINQTRGERFKTVKLGQ